MSNEQKSYIFLVATLILLACLIGFYESSRKEDVTPKVSTCHAKGGAMVRADDGKIVCVQLIKD